MSNTVSMGVVPSTSFFARLMAPVDRWLMTSAGIAIRNDDLPHFGL